MHSKDLHALVETGNLYSKLSTAERLKVGSVIFNERTRNIISVGYNGTPPGEENICENPFNETLPTVIHAEINALNKLMFWQTWGKTLYSSYSPCAMCALEIVRRRIKKVLYLKRYPGRQNGIPILLSNNIEVYQVHYDGHKYFTAANGPGEEDF